MRKVFVLIIFNYGIGFLYRKSNKQHNPKKKGYSSDGSVKRYKLTTNFNEYSDWRIVIRINYNYSFNIRIYMDRD